MGTCRVVFCATATMAVCAGLGAPLARAQEEGLGRHATGALAAPRSDTYGTGSTTNYVLQAFEFVPFSGAGTNVLANNFGSRACSSPCVFNAPAMLPSGALIVALELEACDIDGVAQLTAFLFRVGMGESSVVTLASVSTGASPGCAFFNVNLTPAPAFVNNESASYIVQVSINGTGFLTRFQAVRLVYRLQVSPGPATATFPNDVPTSHPFFRFVEALAAAGITGGCGAGSYCPDTPVTRGQMAVFLATALGLHFPN